MDRILVVVFDTETKAYEGDKALMQLDAEGSISVYTCAVVAKSADGTVTLKQAPEPAPVRTLVGTLVGGFIGLLGGPVGLAIGMGSGIVGGAVLDLNNARIGEEFVSAVGKLLVPTKLAVIAEIEEECTTPVDTRMEAIGGAVFRRTLSAVKHTMREERIATMKADLAQMKAELAHAHAERKAKLQETIKDLDSKLQAQLLEANDRRDAAEWEAKAKAEDLERQTADANAAESHIHPTIDN